MIFSILIFILFFIAPTPILAITNPLDVPNNKYGIHIADTGDIREAARLVNSSGGDWGYVTVVVSEQDRDVGRWQELFNLMRRVHLIPIVRIATHIEKDYWTIPQEIDAQTWVNFLDALNWPIQNRYVVLFNEPNHSKEWGGTVNPEEYANLAYTYGEALKKKSDDFFILPAGLDFSASSDGQAMDANDYLKRMYSQKPELFSLIDGWTSHSYPNPGFSGSPNAFGRGTISSFLYEQQLLTSLGMTKKLPIFITETGWIHNQGKFITSALSPEMVGMYFLTASRGVWDNKDIVAITPFIFNYQDVPFDHFSFKKFQSDDYYPQYNAYQQIEKIKGAPKQFERYELTPALIPNELIVNSTYTLTSNIKNTGQSILSSETHTVQIMMDGEYSFLADSLPILEPQESGDITIHLKTPKEEGVKEIKLLLQNSTGEVLLEDTTILFIPPPNLSLTIPYAFKERKSVSEATVLVYSQNNQLIHKFTDLTIENNKLTITGLYNIIPGKEYRVVILVPYYLPRQTIVTIQDKSTQVTFKMLLPFDINRDGALTFADLSALFFTKPKDVIGRIF